MNKLDYNELIIKLSCGHFTLRKLYMNDTHYFAVQDICKMLNLIHSEKDKMTRKFKDEMITLDVATCQENEISFRGRTGVMFAPLTVFKKCVDTMCVISNDKEYLTKLLDSYNEPVRTSNSIVCVENQKVFNILNGLFKIRTALINDILYFVAEDFRQILGYKSSGTIKVSLSGNMVVVPNIYCLTNRSIWSFRGNNGLQMIPYNDVVSFISRNSFVSTSYKKQLLDIIKNNILPCYPSSSYETINTTANVKKKSTKPSTKTVEPKTEVNKPIQSAESINTVADTNITSLDNKITLLTDELNSVVKVSYTAKIETMEKKLSLIRQLCDSYEEDLKLFKALI